MLVPLDPLSPGSPAGGVTLGEGPHWRHMVVLMYLGVGPVVWVSCVTYMSSVRGQFAALLFLALAAALLRPGGMASSPGPGRGATFGLELPASPRAAGTTAEERSAA